MTVSISVRDLRKSYPRDFSLSSFFLPNATARRKLVLDGLTFDVSQGERVGIVGENGAGKSTLLRIISGLTNPTSGEIQISGRVHAALTLGLGLRETMTGRQNLIIDCELQGLSSYDAKERSLEMIKFADLGEFIDRPVSTYSSGMKSRLAFAGLVFIDPEILLIDEALSAGDQWFQKKASSAIRNLCDRGKIVIIVSHSRSAIVDLCSRCLWLRSGKIEADGDPREVVADYSNYQRDRDETQLAEQFKAAAKEELSSGKVKVTRLKLINTSSAPPRAVFAPGDSATISFDLKFEQPSSTASVNIRIERIDGLMVTENRHTIAELGVARGGSYSFDVAIAPLMLGPSAYLLFTEILEGEKLISRSSLQFKVETDMRLLGGRPSLYVPVSVSVEKMEPETGLSVQR